MDFVSKCFIKSLCLAQRERIGGCWFKCIFPAFERGAPQKKNCGAPLLLSVKKAYSNDRVKKTASN